MQGFLFAEKALFFYIELKMEIYMKKWCLFFVLFIVLVVGSYASYLYAYRAEFLSTALSKLFEAPVEIKAITCSSDGITLHKVVVYNPKGSTIQTAFSTPVITITTDWKDALAALFGTRTATLNEIRIEQPLFGIE